MGLFVLIGRDGENAAELRRRHREAHLRKLAPLDEAGRIAFAGPLLDAAGNPVGTVIVFEAADLEAARRFGASDPYVVGGVFARWDVWGSRQVFPAATS